MSNIIDYARTETRSFEALPFREADALVLAQLSYDEVPECVLRLDDLVAKIRYVAGACEAIRYSASDRIVAYAAQAPVWRRDDCACR